MTHQLKPTDKPFAPIFIVGHPRSGTTLLAALLDRNSQIAVTPETHFANVIAGLLPSLRKQAREAALDALLKKTRLNDLKLERSQLERHLDGQPLTAATTFRAALETYAEQHNKTRVAEKTPIHIRYLPQLFSWFPHAKVIWIVRDGRDAVLSLLNVAWATTRIWQLSLQWVRNVGCGLEYERTYPGKIYRIGYEALLRDAETELIALHRFLGIDFEPGQLDHRQETSIVPAWEESWKGKARQALDPGRANVWRHQASPHQRCVMNCLMGPYLRKLHYADTDLSECGPWAGTASAMARIGMGLVLHRRVYPFVDGFYRCSAGVKTLASRLLERRG